MKTNAILLFLLLSLFACTQQQKTPGFPQGTWIKGGSGGPLRVVALVPDPTLKN